MELPQEALDIYNQEEIAKFLATVDGQGKVNVVLIISQLPGETGKLVFGEFMMWKTKRNLNANGRVASMAMTKNLQSVEVLADLEGFVDTGPYVEKVNSISMFRYNAYTGIRRVGILDITQVYPRKNISYFTVLKDFIAVKLAKTLVKADGLEKSINIPRAVASKINSLLSICALAYVGEDGYPRILPVVSSAVLNKGYLVIKLAEANRELADIGLPIQVAVNVITMEPTSYQVKGSLERIESHLGSRLGLIRLDEVYSAMPPLCGERIV